ncbi:hypothetical protein ACS0Y7_35500 [Burkholderia gladioli]|uniref:hypothetical protein n=1 Tax=Burkholderia gladioli TaxID=28095 RepID=UPI003F799445
MEITMQHITIQSTYWDYYRHMPNEIIGDPDKYLFIKSRAAGGAIVNSGVRGRVSMIRRPAVEEPVCSGLAPA